MTTLAAPPVIPSRVAPAVAWKPQRHGGVVPPPRHKRTRHGKHARRRPRREDPPGKILVDRAATLVPLQEGQGQEERVLRRMRPVLAAAPDQRQAEGRSGARLVIGTQASDGKPQVTYNGHPPVYGFVMDKRRATRTARA